MIFPTVPLTIFILSFLVIRYVHMDHYGPPLSINQPAEYIEDLIEDEVDYAPLLNSADTPDYDWSPPNGELPDNTLKIAGPLNTYLGDDLIRDRQDVHQSWNDEDNSLFDDTAKAELKRAFDFPRRKKNQVLCRVQKAIHHHSEAGHEFFPKSYTSYSCHPVSPAQLEGSLATSHDTCYVTGNNCITIEKEQLFLKRRQNIPCWTHFIEAVGAGCKCLSRKY